MISQSNSNNVSGIRKFYFLARVNIYIIRTSSSKTGVGWELAGYGCLFVLSL